jgi:hypothetical protein
MTKSVVECVCGNCHGSFTGEFRTGWCEECRAEDDEAVQCWRAVEEGDCDEYERLHFDSHVREYYFLQNTPVEEWVF